MANIQPRFRQVPSLLALILEGYHMILNNDRVEEGHVQVLKSMHRETQLAYTVSELVALDCESALKCLRMGSERARDRFQKARERDLDALVLRVLGENAITPTGLVLPRRHVAARKVAG